MKIKLLRRKLRWRKLCNRRWEIWKKKLGKKKFRRLWCRKKRKKRNPRIYD